MSDQLDLFERFREPLATPPPREPRVPEADRPRLSGQCQRILELLRRGPCTNVELAEVSLKYSGRISDLRKRGYRIEPTNLGGGLWRYELLP